MARARSNSACQPMIRKGSSGEAVKLLQTLLAEKGYSPTSSWVNWKWGGSDALGTFGSETVEAVKAYQSDEGLGADGVVGPSTWKALGQAGCTSSGSGLPAVPLPPPSFYTKWWFWALVGVGTVGVGGGVYLWRTRKK